MPTLGGTPRDIVREPPQWLTSSQPANRRGNRTVVFCVKIMMKEALDHAEVRRTDNED